MLEYKTAILKGSLFMENNKLIIVIGEKPTNVPEEFSTIEMYYRTKDNSLEYYA